MKFKKGDLVKVVCYSGHSFEMGEIVKISGIDSPFHYICANKDGLTQYVIENQIEMHTPQSAKESKEDTVARLEKELEEAKKALNKAPVVNGQEMFINRKQGSYMIDTIQFGCAIFSSSIFSDVVFYNIAVKDNSLGGEIGLNRTIASITLDSGVEVSAEQCKEITDYYDKNNK